MADLTFNTPSGQTIARELLIAYLNTGTASAPMPISVTYGGTRTTGTASKGTDGTITFTVS